MERKRVREAAKKEEEMFEFIDSKGKKIQILFH